MSEVLRRDVHPAEVAMPDQTVLRKCRVFVTVARCPEHGLHGLREECFACGGPVQQVRMLQIDAIETQEPTRSDGIGGCCARPPDREAIEWARREHGPNGDYERSPA
jgi:hypothetical protein